MSGVVLDAGGPIAIDRGDRMIVALIERASEHGLPVTIPAAALAQAIRIPANKQGLPG